MRTALKNIGIGVTGAMIATIDEWQNILPILDGFDDDGMIKSLVATSLDLDVPCDHNNFEADPLVESQFEISNPDEDGVNRPSTHVYLENGIPTIGVQADISAFHELFDFLSESDPHTELCRTMRQMIHIDLPHKVDDCLAKLREQLLGLTLKV